MVVVWVEFRKVVSRVVWTDGGDHVTVGWYKLFL